MPQVILDFIAQHHIPISHGEARAIWIVHRGCIWKTLNSLRTFESNSRFVYKGQADQIMRLKEAEQKQKVEAAAQASFRAALNRDKKHAGAHARKARASIQAMLND